jgi:hypothetical protein
MSLLATRLTLVETRSSPSVTARYARLCRLCLVLDHIQPPLLGHRHWGGFHGWCAAAMAGRLNDRLPPEYFAEFQVTVVTQIEVDVFRAVLFTCSCCST